MSDVPPHVPAWTDVVQSDGSTFPAPPPVDPAMVRPSVADVAALERTRTVGESGADDLTTFDETTRPSAAEVDGLIDAAAVEVLGWLPSHVDPVWFEAIERVVARRVAQMIEVSYFREQQAASSTPAQADLQSLQGLIPRAAYVG